MCVCERKTKRKEKQGEKKYLKLGPVHAHVDSVIEGPPLEVFVVVGVVDCVV